MQPPTKSPEQKEEDGSTKKGLTAGHKVAGAIVLLCLLYMFLFGLGLMGDAFKVMGGRSAASLFKFTDNPVAGLMAGIFATVLVQSSSTSTSIVVGLVGADQITTLQAIPIIMGANIGTSVTNTIVSLAHGNKPDEFEAAFSGATVHDMFNLLSVAIFLPVEVITGYLYHLSTAMTASLGGSGGGTFKSPIKIIVSPLIKLLVSVDKTKIKAASKGQDVICDDGEGSCDVDVDDVDYCTGECKEMSGSLMKGGAFSKMGLSDNAAGIILLMISLAVLCIALYLIVRVLNKLVRKQADAMVTYSLNFHPIVAMLAGMAATICVQSSSITTSALTPLIGLGLVSLEQALPLTLGANIGTTVTAMLASMVTGKVNAVQVAICHLFFNISGILVWYPIPAMRQVPLSLARLLGRTVRHHRWVAILYTGTVFVALPGLFLVISAFGGVVAVTVTFILVVLIVATLLFYAHCYHFKPERLQKSWIPEKFRPPLTEAVTVSTTV